VGPFAALLESAVEAAVRFGFFGVAALGRFGPSGTDTVPRFLTTALRFVGIALLGCSRVEIRFLSKDK
jgi:hypothetical protein